MPTKNKKQHYIPQYYLKNFGNNNHIHIYDLKTKTEFSNSISNIAFKKYFYNVDVDVFNKMIIGEDFSEPDFIDKIINKHNESILAPFFDSFNSTRQRLIDKDYREVVSIIDFYSLVDFILVQTYRNPKLSSIYRTIDDIIKSEYEPNSTKNYDSVVRGLVLLFLFNELHYGRVTEMKKEVKDAFALIRDEIVLMKELLTNSHKVVFWNRTSVDFLSSDCAMGFLRSDSRDLFTSVFVPINTKVGVLLINKGSVLYDKEEWESGVINNVEEKDIKQILALNQTLIEKANRFVYSIDSTFPAGIIKVKYKEWWNIK